MKQVIGIGASANDGTGDTLRVALDKVNDNFNELYGYISIGATAGATPTAGEVIAALGAAATNGAGWSKRISWTNLGTTYYGYIWTNAISYILIDGKILT
jgi:hypothetical protein